MSFHEVGKDAKHQLAAVLHAEAQKQAIEMRAHRRNGDAQIPGDLLVGMTEEELLNDGDLATRERQVALDLQPFPAGENRSLRCRFHLRPSLAVSSAPPGSHH